MAEQVARDTRGSNNPNWKNAGWHKCGTCGVDFHSYTTTRKFCSHRCAGHSPENLAKLRGLPPAGRPPGPQKLCAGCGVRPVFYRGAKHCGDAACAKACKKVRCDKRTVPPTPAPNKVCAQCGKAYHSYTKGRLYCGYQCHLASGGALRAGLASAKATMKYGAKKDANHNEVFEEMRKHCAVYDFSAAGCGLPDGIAWVAEQWRLFDVKNPKTGYGRRGLNKVQKRWLSQWKGGPVYLIYSADEARRFGTGDLDGIKLIFPEEALRLLEAA